MTVEHEQKYSVWSRGSITCKIDAKRGPQGTPGICRDRQGVMLVLTRGQ